MENTSANPPDTFPAPVLPAKPPATKFERERSAFYKLLPELLKTHANQYVAVHEGKVVASGTDKVDVGLRAYKEFGYIPIYVDLVADRPLPPGRFSSPRSAVNMRLS